MCTWACFIVNKEKKETIKNLCTWPTNNLLIGAPVLYTSIKDLNNGAREYIVTCI